MYTPSINKLEDVNEIITNGKTLKDAFKSKMLKGIVAIQIDVNEVQGKAKLSQNKTAQEIESIIAGLAGSTLPNESLVAEYMDRYARKHLR